MTVTATPIEAGKNESFDSTGRLEIPDDALLSEDEVAPAEPAPAEPGKPAEPAKPAEEEDEVVTDPEPTKDPEGTVRAKPGDKEYDPRLPDDAQPIIKQAEPAKPTEPAKPAEPAKPTEPAAPKLYAGKYSTVEELKSAFIQLGGDPQNYGDDPDKIAEAYSVRQAEFTRSRQALAEQERQQQYEKQKAERQQKVQTLVTTEIQKVMEKKPQNVAELLTHLTEAMTNIVTQTQVEPQAPIDPNEIAATIQPIMQKREAAIKELNDIETEVPRLKSDINFRNAFAIFVQGQKTNGTYTSMKESMKSFVGPSQAIINDEVKKQQDAAAAKNDVIATQQPNGGQNSSTPAKRSAEDDILGGILSEHDARIKKFQG